MKHFFLVTFLSLLCLSSYGNCFSKVFTQEPTKQEIDINNSSVHGTGHERGVLCCVKAFICIQTKTIEVELYGTEETDIYILNANNDIIDECIVDSFFTSSATLSLPKEKGQYYIVIDSPVLYGEGTFVIK